MLKVKITWLIVVWILVATTLSAAQGIPDSAIKRIDNLFAEWNNKNTPGFIVGIVKNDSLVFTKGYGMANLEYGVPITTNTRFYIASVSKQFTGYCITLLARQKKLNLEEDIRVYLPWLPDFKKKITVRNLLNHTSGIRDDLNMIAISGLSIDGTLTNDQVLRTLKMQRTLNFNPGERYSYSNSNYILLAEIVKAVSGRSLRQFADSAIFKPLDMTNTHFHDDASELIENRAVSYWANEKGGYSNAFQNVYTVGDGGLFTTVKDASKWVTNFYDPIAGDLQDIEALTKTGKLTSGKQLSYASGISVGEEGRWKVYSHAGGLHGYGAIISVFPELKTGFIIFGNIRKGDIHGKVNQLASLIIAPKKPKSENTSHIPNRPKNFSGDSLLLKRYQGEYISDDGYLLNVSWNEGKLLGSGFGQNFETVAKEKSNTYLFPSKNNPITKIVFGDGGKSPEFDLEFPDEILHFSKLNDSIKLKPEDLIGEYYCPELDCTYKIILRDRELFLSNAIYPDSKLTIRETHMKRDSWFMNHMKVTIDKNKVTGFEVNSGNVMHLGFIKMK